MYHRNVASHSTFQPSLLPLFPNTDNKSFLSQILDYGQRTQKLLPNIQLSKFTVETIIMCPHLHVCDSCSPDQCRSTIDKRPLVVMKQGCIVKISYTYPICHVSTQYYPLAKNFANLTLTRPEILSMMHPVHQLTTIQSCFPLENIPVFQSHLYVATS